MLKKTVKYVDYDGAERTETLYFNLTKAEISRIQMREDGNFIAHMQRLLEKRHVEELFLFIEDFVKKAYGEKSLDGARFIKTPEKTQDFEWSPAFSEVLMEIVQNPEKLQEFVLGVIPADMRNSMNQIDVQTLPRVD